MNFKILTLFVFIASLALVHAKDENDVPSSQNMNMKSGSGEALESEAAEAANEAENNMYNFNEAYFADPDADFDFEEGAAASTVQEGTQP